MTELKTCPFCGGEVEIVHPYHGPMGAYIFCLNCRLSIYRGTCWNNKDVEEMIEKWNKRAKE